MRKFLMLAAAILVAAVCGSAWAGLVFTDEQVAQQAPVAKELFKPVAPKPVWRGIKGESLSEALNRWATDEKWTVIWDTKTDYQLFADVVFEGELDVAVMDFIRLYKDAPQPLRVEVQKPQHVIYVTNAGRGQ